MSTSSALEWLHWIGRQFPDVWSTYARVIEADSRANRWPSWCWAPFEVTLAVTALIRLRERLRDSDATKKEATVATPLHALAAWRATQGIYRIHPELLLELLKTPTPSVPREVLFRLPEWCVYVELSEQKASGYVRGFWATMDAMSLSEPACELVLVWDLVRDGKPALRVSRLKLQHEEVTIHEALQARAAEEGEALDVDPHEELSLGRMLSVLLWLCTDEPDGIPHQALPPKVVRGAKRVLMPAARAPRIYTTGMRMGAALEAAHRLRNGTPRVGAGATPEPHVRRAHFHHYWVGSGERRRLSLRWLSPILVGFEGVPEVATVRPVRGPRPTV